MHFMSKLTVREAFRDASQRQRQSVDDGKLAPAQVVETYDGRLHGPGKQGDVLDSQTLVQRQAILSQNGTQSA
jgi:hypothetical protein